jgi:PKD repeat protein
MATKTVTIINLLSAGAGVPFAPPAVVGFLGGIFECINYIWYFGDGETSREVNPVHVYTMPGVYTIIRVCVDENGVEHYYVYENLIEVSDYGISDDSSKCDKCYRLPVLPGDGYGVSEYQDNDRPGFDWLWPQSDVGTQIGYDEQRQELALVCDEKTQEIYQINDPEVWRDREGYRYGGNVIKRQIWEKAHRALAGEHETIKANEFHVILKPYDYANRGAPGFNATGYPTGAKLDMGMFLDGEQRLPEASATGIPENGDIVFDHPFEARSMQPRYTMYGAPYYLTQFISNYSDVDKAGSPSQRTMLEDGYQVELSSMPLFRITRNFNPYRNVATSRDATRGAVSDTAAEGPDGKTYSALLFYGAGAFLRDTTPHQTPNGPEERINSDFGAMAWVNSMFTNSTLFVVGSLTIQVTIVAGVYAIVVTDGINPALTATLAFTGGVWTHLAIVRSGMEWRVYENGVLVTRQAIVTVVDYGSTILFGNNAAMLAADICVLPRAPSADALVYYHNDVVNRGGKVCLPPF